MTGIKQKQISLVLGSGGARGLAHIGVIHWLEEHAFKIESISGCSMGALIGGIYAAGKLDEFEKWVRAITKVDLVTLLDLSWGKSGLIKGDRIINTLIDLVGDQLIEDLPINFTAVATDLKNEKEVWLQSGPLFDAIRSSISLPLFFTPFTSKGVALIDGGILNPVPIAPTFGDRTDMTIAVNLGGQIDASYGEAEIKQPWAENLSLIQEKISLFIERFKAPEIHHSGLDWDMYDVASQAFEAMQSTIARQKLASYPPDHTIEIARNACRTMEFYRAAEMIDLGYARAQACLGKIYKEG